MRKACVLLVVMFVLGSTVVVSDQMGLMSPGLTARVADARGNVPDYIYADQLTIPSVFLVEVESGSQWQNSEKCGAKIVLRNPTYTLFFKYSVRSGADAMPYTPVTSYDSSWHQVGLVPPGGTVTYWVEAERESQRLFIESDLLDPEALAVTMFVQLLNLVPGMTEKSSSEIIRAIGDSTRVWSLMRKFVDISDVLEVLQNPGDVFGNMRRLEKAAEGLVAFTNSSEGRSFILDVLSSLGMSISDQALEKAMNVISIVGKLKLIPDAVVSTGISIWSGSSVNRYEVYGLNTDSSD